MRRSIVMHSRATTGGVRPNVKENGQLRPSNAIPDAWKAGSRPYREFGLPASSENAYPRASSGGIWGIPVYRFFPSRNRRNSMVRIFAKNSSINDHLIVI
jgi:hypothetical protein